MDEINTTKEAIKDLCEKVIILNVGQRESTQTKSFDKNTPISLASLSTTKVIKDE